MTNERRPAFRLHTRDDLARSGMVAAVWVVFYVLLAVYAGFWPGHAPKLASAATERAAPVEGGGSVHAATLRPHHERAVR